MSAFIRSLSASLPCPARWLALFFVLAICQDMRAADQPPAGRVSFLSNRTVLRVGSSQVIAFRTAKPAETKRFFSFQTDENSLRVLLPPTQLAGESVGYLRLLGLRPGVSTLELDGAKLEIKVMEDHSALSSETVAIVTPVRGAVVWGKFAVGVEQFAPDAASRTRPMVLRLPSGKEVLPNDPLETMPPPARRVFFEVNAQDLAEGANDLVAVVKQPGGPERASRPLHLICAKAKPQLIAEGECRDTVHGPRPAKTSEELPTLTDDRNYPGGKVVSNNKENPVWCVSVPIKDEGQYQMFVTARGDAGGGALPTVGLVLDNETNPATTSRLASTVWHRVAVGHPVRLKAGEHILSVRYRNDFSRGQNNDRNLALAHYELARVDEAAPQSASFSVAFESPIDGRTVTGGVNFNAVCQLKKDAPLPRVQLFVNARPVAQAQGARPSLHAPANAFQAGRNAVYFIATGAAGERARSVTEFVYTPSEWHPSAEPDLPALRFPVDDPAWNRELAASIHGPKREALFASNGEASVALPDSLQGEFTLWIAARGDEFEGPPELAVELKQPTGAIAKLERVSVKKDSDEIRAGVLQLEKGAKQLKLAFDNDRYEPGKGDRNLYLRAVRLEPVTPSVDPKPPTAKILYPADGQLVGQVDAVVAEVCDDRAIASVDLRIDGQSQKVNLAPEKGLGPVVLPLLTRGLAPGGHRLEVEARDLAGNVGHSQTLNLRIAAAGENVAGPYQHALLLLNRFAYGPEPRELAEVLTKGPRAWLQARLYEDANAPAERNLARQLEAGFHNDNNGEQVVRQAFRYLLGTGNPVRARFVMWAENHFSTWLNKDGATAKADEHRRFVEVGPGRFFDLLLASATSPAMLVYLDQRNSVADKLNENYAREIMELHTLGVKGGYTQKDVTTLADLLTGWSVAEEADEEGDANLKPDFRFDSFASSGHFCRVLGMEFPGVEREERFDRIRSALEMLTAHPSCAEFVCRKLAEHYVADPAPPNLVQDLAKVFRESGGDLREVLCSLGENPEFFRARPKLASPIDYGVRAARIAGLENADLVRDFTSSSGMGMFDRATPDGYPEGDDDFAGSNSMLQRWRFAQKTKSDRIIPASWRPEQDAQNSEAMRRTIDLVAVRLTGNILSEATTQAAIQLLEDAPPKAEARLALLVAFIGQSPEASLR